MKIRMFSVLLAALLLCGMMTPCAQAAGGYTDVPENHWAAADIRAATEAGLFQGVEAGVFGLKQSMTRAQYVTALVRLFGWEEVRPAAPSFADCAPDRWFYAAVETACANGALHGYKDEFRPNDPITREEMTTMLVRGLGYANQAGQVAHLLPFGDVMTNRGYIALAYDMGIVTGYDDGLFHPDAEATREQAAALLARVWRRIETPSVMLTEETAEGYLLLQVSTPAASVSTALPTTPLEPFDELYSALAELRREGTDMSRVAVVLSTGGEATTVHGSRITKMETLTAEEVAEYREEPGVRTYYSQRYQCAYMIVPTVGSGRITVWYQDQQAVQAKLQLCRLFGVTSFVLQ